MLSEHISGLALSGACRRSCKVMPWPPPVVMFTTALVCCLMRGRNSMNTSALGVGGPGGRVQIDGLHRPHEGPAQAEPVLDRLVEILSRHIALIDQPERLVEQRRLQAIEDEALELAIDRDRHLTRALHQRAGANHH